MVGSKQDVERRGTGRGGWNLPSVPPKAVCCHSQGAGVPVAQIQMENTPTASLGFNDSSARSSYCHERAETRGHPHPRLRPRR